MNLRVLLLSILVFCAANLGRADEPEIRLSKRQQEAIANQVVPVYQLSNPAMLLRTLVPIVAKMDDRFHEGANQLLTNNGFPTIEVMLTDARLSFVQQNMGNQLPPPSRFESQLLLKTLGDRIQTVFDDQDKHTVMSDPIPNPKSLKEHKKLFWEIHVLNNRLINAGYLAAYAKALSGSKGSKTTVAIGDKVDIANLPAQVQRRIQELEERSIELRLKRLQFAATVFKPFDPQKPVAYSAGDRLMAAHILGMDQTIVERFFQRRSKSDTPFIRESLTDQVAIEKVIEEAQASKKQAGNLVAKTQLLYEAIHWWMRGRYGRGPHSNGLAKGHEALFNPQAMFTLHMPMATPKPSNPLQPSLTQTPEVDRRHHYTWTTEKRRIYISGNKSSFSETSDYATEITMGPPPPGATGNDYFS